MDKVDIINLIISKFKFKKYLEIGVQNPDNCFNKINCAIKHSVDINEEFKQFYTHAYTSDQFFSKLKSSELDLHCKYQWDLIFIDGLHLAEQVHKDLHNSLEHINENGYIVIHDCNPPSIYFAREDLYDFNTPAGDGWYGSVWKCIQLFRQKNFDIATVDIDTGVGVLRKGFNSKNLSLDINPYYEYNTFDKNRNKILNLCSFEQFHEWLNEDINNY
jgi:hypothetical protein